MRGLTVLLCLAVIGCAYFSTAAASCPCTDKAPSKEYTCKQQADYGACLSDWMVNGQFCEKTCGRCRCVTDCSCKDVPPPNTAFTCADQKRFGNCEQSWMKDGKFCEDSCGRCKCAGAYTPKSTTRSPSPSPRPSVSSSPSPAANRTVTRALRRPTPPKPEGCNCTDIDPVNSTYNCEQQKDFGQCSDDWIVKGGFCQWTCGYCTKPNCPGAPKPADLPVKPKGKGNWVELVDTEEELMGKKSPAPAAANATSPKTTVPTTPPKTTVPTATPKTTVPTATPKPSATVPATAPAKANNSLPAAGVPATASKLNITIPTKTTVNVSDNATVTPAEVDLPAPKVDLPVVSSNETAATAPEADAKPTVAAVGRRKLKMF